MRRIAILIGALALAGVALVPTATAEKPVRFFLPSEDFVIEGACDFAVDFHVLSNKEYAIEFKDGRIQVSGTFKVRLTNRSSGKSLDVNISGPGVYRFSSDEDKEVMEVTAWGNWLLWFYPGMIGDQGALYLTSGLAKEVLVFDGDDVEVRSLTLPPRTRDACALLS